MIFLKKYGFYFLLMGVISDFLTLYILGMFYTEMDQMKMVISILGEVGSPVRPAFLIWSVISGSFLYWHCRRCILSFSVRQRYWRVS